MPELRRTPLYDAHVAAGARLVPFAGWEMPVQYEGVGAEHLAVRSGCGVFDVSHMGEIETDGPGALDLLQRLLSNDVAKLDVGGAQYSVLCREDGGVLDDLFTYRLADGPLPHRHQRRQPRARPRLVSRARGRLRLRGRRLARRLGDAGGAGARRARDRRPADRGRAARAHAHRDDCAGGAECLVCGTGYTGEDGVEVLCRPDDATALWDALLAEGASPAGLGARDTLRLEVCFHLYGNDLSEDRNPIEAGLGWCCKEGTGFIGTDAVAAARESGTAEKLAPFVLTEPGHPAPGQRR